MITLSALVARLGGTCRAALTRAVERCVAAGCYVVEIEHLMLELLSDPGSDFTRALTAYEIDTGALKGQLVAALARFSTGSVEAPALSTPLSHLFESAWLIASVDHNAARIGSACLLRAALEDGRLREPLIAIAPALGKVPRQRLSEDMAALIASGHEGRGGSASGGLPAVADRARLDSGIADFTVDLTAQASEGRLDPVIGREAEIDQVVEILMRRRQNNPILIGEAGVGKTAIVEGLAQRIAERRVPAALARLSLRSLDLGALQAGASAPGAFEARLRDLIDAIGGDPGGTLLFIDEAHMLIGAGGPAGLGDTANLLKPALARGELRTIAATTWAEYKRYIEKDAALVRRFQPVKVEPPSAETTVAILRQLAPRLEAHHGVAITEEALASATQMSQRYIADRRLPDKAIAVLDTACARVSIAQTSWPRALAGAELRCAELDTEIARLSAETAPVPGRNERLDQLAAARQAAEDARNAIAARWEQERYTFDRIRDLEPASGSDGEHETQLELEGLYLELAEIQQDAPMIPLSVDRRTVADVVSAWTGVPVAAILGSRTKTGRELKAELARRVVGQDRALDAIVRRVQTFQAGLGDPSKPTGVFLLCGPSGVGKTETALALADLLYSGGQSLITVNMSEYQEAHSVSGLKGAPPGYVGYGRGGVLTEAVRRQPYSVVLLDEVEKAHPDVLEIFYQVFDRGMLEDSEGVPIDFTQTLILLTSNLGSELIERAGTATAEALEAALRPELLRRFPPAFLARLTVVPYRPLGPVEIAEIVRLKLVRIGERFEATRAGQLTWDPAVVAAIAAAAQRADGARGVDAILAHQLLPELSERLLTGLVKPGRPQYAHIAVAPDGGLRVEVAH